MPRIIFPGLFAEELLIMSWALKPRILIRSTSFQYQPSDGFVPDMHPHLLGLFILVMLQRQIRWF